MSANDSRRFIVKMEVYAAAGHVDLTLQEKMDAASELDAVMRQLAEADPDEVEDQTYRALRFDLCDACRKRMLSHPLG